MKDLVACTITNTGPALILRKIVDNVGGGTLTPADWTLTATSTTTGKVVTTASDATVPVPVGEYTLRESPNTPGANRYVAGAWSCTNAGTVTQNVTKVSVAAGKSVICTSTNTYVPPTVTVTKTWVNGVNGDKTDLAINGATTSPGKATSTSNGSLASWTDAANVAKATPLVGNTVTVAEVLQSTNNKGTYTSSDAVCLDGSGVGVVVSSGSFKMPNSDVTCEFTNTVMLGAVTWSKVDAGSTSTLLTGSAWTLTGPSYPSPGTTVADCTSYPCAGPDTNPAAGRLSVLVLRGDYVLVEKTAPIGFQLDDFTRHSFTVSSDGTTVPVGLMISNKRLVMPPLPLTGGASTDAFLLAGYALIAAAGFAGWRQRRRLLRSL